MEIEYSTEIKGEVYAYRFYKFEKQIISKALQPEVKKLEGKIQKIISHPNNEGQASYSCQIDELRKTIECLQGIIKEFTVKP